MKKIKVCLDAGHYGKYNQSPANKEYYESDMSWKLHLLLKKHLESYDIEVVVTRTNKDTDLLLERRGQKSKDCDLFLSLHSNAVGSYVDESINYVAAYHLTDDSTTKCDDLSKVIAEALAPVVAKVMEIPKYRVLTRKSDDDRNGDGVMNDNYYGVLNGARSVNTPGILLEHSFHTNTRTTNWLLNDSNLDKLAKAEAKVIAEYFGAKKIDTVTTCTSADINTGDEAIFTGNTHYTNANATSGKTCKPGKVIVTKIIEGRHPYHVKAKAGGTSTAHGWVNADDLTPVRTTIAEGDKVKVKQGAKTYTGGKLALYVYRRTYTVQSVTGDRVVITMGDTVIAAVNIADLERV